MADFAVIRQGMTIQALRMEELTSSEIDRLLGFLANDKITINDSLGEHSINDIYKQIDPFLTDPTYTWTTTSAELAELKNAAKYTIYNIHGVDQNEDRLSVIRNMEVWRAAHATGGRRTRYKRKNKRTRRSYRKYRKYR